MKRPNMYDGGLTLFLTMAFPPNPSASSVVNTHLLAQFNPLSYIVLTGAFPGSKKIEIPLEVNKHYVYLSLEFFSSRLHDIVQKIQKITLPLLLKYYIERYKPSRIIITYPDLFWLNLCTKVIEKLDIPFVLYLHDTIIEGANTSLAREQARKVQQLIFNKSHKIAVISDGMKFLYSTKYQISTDTWQHIFPEETIQEESFKIERAHWSGDIYKINNHAVSRLSKAFSILNIPLTISNGKTRDELRSFGIEGNISKVYYPCRTEYLTHLNSSKILLLGLNYPDECDTHEDELATIFSTKTIEYLASNGLIIYHGPSYYFLAKFIIDNSCGIVIDTRNETEILIKISEIMKNFESYRPIIQKAKESLIFFNPHHISAKIRKTLI